MVVRSVKYQGEELLDGMRYGFNFNVCLSGISDPLETAESLEEVLSNMQGAPHSPTLRRNPNTEGFWVLIDVRRYWYFNAHMLKEYKEVVSLYHSVTLEVIDKERCWSSESGPRPLRVDLVTEHAKDLDED